MQFVAVWRKQSILNYSHTLLKEILMSVDPVASTFTQMQVKIYSLSCNFRSF